LYIQQIPDHNKLSACLFVTYWHAIRWVSNFRHPTITAFCKWIPVSRYLLYSVPYAYQLHNVLMASILLLPTVLKPYGKYCWLFHSKEVINRLFKSEICYCYNKVVVGPCVVVVLGISNSSCAARSSNVVITCTISPWILLHVVQFLFLTGICFLVLFSYLHLFDELVL